MNFSYYLWMRRGRQIKKEREREREKDRERERESEREREREKLLIIQVLSSSYAACLRDID